MTLKESLSFIVSFIFAIFMISVPWEQFQGYRFIDLNNYKTYFLYETPVYEYVNLSKLMDFITREALWHYAGFFVIKDLGIQPSIYFYSISFFCLFIFALIVQKYSCFYCVLFLINPLVVTLCMSQLRSALALSVLFVAYIINSRFAKIFLPLIAMFLHTSVVIFLLIFFFILF